MGEGFYALRLFALPSIGRLKRLGSQRQRPYLASSRKAIRSTSAKGSVLRSENGEGRRSAPHTNTTSCVGRSAIHRHEI